MAHVSSDSASVSADVAEMFETKSGRIDHIARELEKYLRQTSKTGGELRSALRTLRVLTRDAHRRLQQNRNEEEAAALSALPDRGGATSGKQPSKRMQLKAVCKRR